MKPRLQAARRRTEKTLPASWPTSAQPFGPPIRLLHTIADHGLFPKMILAHRLPKTEAREISGLSIEGSAIRLCRCCVGVPGGMIGPPLGARIWIAAGVTNLRRGFTGLSAAVQTVLEQDSFVATYCISAGVATSLTCCSGMAMACLCFRNPHRLQPKL